ncbi:methyltransferase domain-containing protein [Chelatococcus sp. XZ-Ab1]|uniref:class I SAM-dependent methyltransferase n=1 Tax=Chelatococcus sp. XZ-Ab1 TaxID=3034027 RepID=UPI0023E45731|nr:methyltransferase domain-containing protein [Chelatococcus sp. XZ-Ab1]
MSVARPSDLVQFLRAWCADPARVGAVAPSGAALAELITREIGPASAPVIELGPGTGAFTEAILARGVDARDLVLVEYGSDFARLLQARFDRARVLWMDAARLAQVELFDGRPAGAVVSGLPLLNLSPRKVMAILDGAFRHLRPQGAFYQFTYGMRCPVPRTILDRLGLRATHLGRTVRNVPPAAVYRITARPQRRGVKHV